MSTFKEVWHVKHIKRDRRDTLNIPAQQKINALSFAIEYWKLQCEVSRVTGSPLPPCYYCGASQIWTCSKAENNCKAFTEYCSATGWEEPAACLVDSTEEYRQM